VAFVSKRSSGDEASTEKAERRNPLTAILGRRDVEAEHLPAIDVAAGLNRILRATPAVSEAERKTDLDPIRNALASIEASLYAIDTIRDIIEQAYEVAISAQDVEDAGGRALLAESYDELRLSINRAVDDLDERASALLGRNSRNLDVKLGGKAHYSISPTRLDVSPKGLNLEPPREAFATFDEINLVLSELDGALKKADRAAAGYCRDAQFLIARMNAEAAE
jgi:signal transduction histidine kinase